MVGGGVPKAQTALRPPITRWPFSFPLASPARATVHTPIQAHRHSDRFAQPSSCSCPILRATFPASAGFLFRDTMTVATDPRKTGIAVGAPAYTWAIRPAASLSLGTIIFVSDVGMSGVLMVSDGTNWTPVNGSLRLKTMAATVAGIGSSETIILQSLLPAGFLVAPGTIRLTIAGNKSGNVDTARATLRIGTAGTTADTAITGMSNQALAATTNPTYGEVFDVRMLSATSAQKIGVNASATPAYIGHNGSAMAAATTITDASANALFVSVGISSSGATDTVQVTHCALEYLA